MRHNFKKQFGQNFLTQKKFAVKVVDYAQVEPEDTVIEIGPGDGMVTKILLERAAKVIAIEVDYDVIPKLLMHVGNDPRLEVINESILNINFVDLFAKQQTKRPLKIVGSLPYNISKVIIKMVLDANIQSDSKIFSVASFIVQNEVAIDYVAKAPQSSFLGQTAALFAQLRKKETIPAHQFYPKPKVDGAILQIVIDEISDRELITKTLSLLRSGFSKPRRTVTNNLKGIAEQKQKNITEVFESLGFSTNMRPAELTTDQWKLLAKQLES